MSDKKSKKTKAKSKDRHICSGCRNFKEGKNGGVCKRTGKKRSPQDKACGHYDPL